MKCPYCGHDEDRVLDTRAQKDGEGIRRRRECLRCVGRFTTVETILHAFPHIIKKDGRREPFSKDKVSRGIRLACQKRPVSLEQVEQIVDRVAKWVSSRAEREIASDAIGQKVIKELRQLDNVAYVRFASVYKNFKDVQEFMEALEEPHLMDPQDDDDSGVLKLTPSPQDV